MLTMIIIDDEMIIRESLKRFIDWESIGITVTAVLPNGSKALDFLMENVPDIILSDINMPLLNGIELLEFLSHHKIRSKVIFISAYSKFEYAQAALRLGAFDYILKPIDEEKLLNIVKKCKETILEEQQNLSELKSFKKDSDARFFSLLQHLYYDDYCEISDTDREILLNHHFTSESYHSMLSAGFWHEEETPLSREYYEHLFTALPYDTKIVCFGLEDHLHAVLLLSAQNDPEILYQDVKDILQHMDASGTCRSISMSQPYPFHQHLGRMYTETALAHLLAADLQSVSTFRNVLKKAKRASLQAPPVLPDQMNHSETGVQDILDQKFYQYILDGTIYDQNALKLDLIQFVDSFILDLRDFHQQHQDLYNSTLSSRKTINAQYSIDRIYEVTLHILMNLCEGLHRFRDRSVTQFVRSALDYIHKNYAENISLADAANQLYVSPSYLSKIFSVEIGQPFSKYVLEYRIKKSVELLADPHLKIYDVANMCGFSDIAHFSKTFKQIMGMSPHKYRNQRL